jgi:hypothetical protein
MRTNRQDVDTMEPFTTEEDCKRALHVPRTSAYSRASTDRQARRGLDPRRLPYLQTPVRRGSGRKLPASYVAAR